MVALVKRFPDLDKQIGQTTLDTMYSFPQPCVNYRKLRKIIETKGEQVRPMIQKKN